MKKLIVPLAAILLNFPVISYSLNEEELNYRYRIASSTSELLAVRKIFGEILQSGDLDYSYQASKNVITTLDQIGNDLDTLVVPEKMEDPYNVFLESVKSYRKSAACIRNAAEILLGYFDGTEEDAEELMDMSTDYVELGNKYLDLSFDLHSEVFNQGKKEVFPKDFDKKEKTPDIIPESDDSEKLSI